MKKIYATILASGTGERFGKDRPKQFIKILGKTIIEYSIDAFEKNEYVDEIIIVANPLYKCLTEEIIEKNCYKKVKKILKGGKTRKESSYIGVMSIEEEDALLLIHDGVRPFISDNTINKCIQSLEEYDSIAVAVPSTDTIIQVNNSMFIENIPPREYLMRIQTPQGFKVGLIKKAHKMALNDDTIFTDDCGLIIKYNLSKVYIIKGEESNIKITYPEDLLLAEKIIKYKKINQEEYN